MNYEKLKNVLKPDQIKSLSKNKSKLNQGNQNYLRLTYGNQFIMREELYTNLILKQLNGEINEQEQQKLKNWLNDSVEHGQRYAEIEKIWKLSGEGQDIVNLNMSQEWSRFQQRIQQTEVKKEAKVIRPNWTKTFGRIAAGFLLLIGALYIFQLNNTTSELETIFAQAEKKEILLPDNSKVWLNKNSQLTYDKRFENRIVQLKGEAYFDVQKKNGATFTIETAKTATQVLGTTFNVRAYENEATTDVAVFSGKVSFHGKDDLADAIILTPNEKGIYQNEKKQIVKVSNENANVRAWQQNKLRFNGERLEQIIPTIEKFYKIKISVVNPAIFKCDFKGIFDQLSPEEVMESIAFGLNLDLHKNNEGFELSGAGCE